MVERSSALSVIKTPSEWGADIAVGDGQSLGATSVNLMQPTLSKRL